MGADKKEMQKLKNEVYDILEKAGILKDYSNNEDDRARLQKAGIFEDGIVLDKNRIGALWNHIASELVFGFQEGGFQEGDELATEVYV